MAHGPLLTLGTAVAALVLARAEEPRYAVAAGTGLVRSYHSTTRLDSEPCSLVLAGKPVPSADHPEMRLSVGDDRTLEFTDVIAEVADGRPTRFVRAFDELENEGSESMSVVMPDGTVDKQGSDRERRSELAGRKVGFTWDSRKKEYAKAWVGEGAADELLEKLDGDVDWLDVLPGKPVEEGDAWDLDPTLFVSLQLPGGDLHWRVEGKPLDPVSESLNVQLTANMAGESKATWQGRREVDGKELGIIAIEAELTTQGEAGSDDGREARTMKLEVEYEGEVLWDMDGGHIAGFTFAGKVHALMTISRPLDTPQGEIPMRREFDLRGTSKHELTVTPAK